VPEVSDRELDALVAEKVMGWRWLKDDERPGRWLQYGTSPGRSPATGSEQVVWGMMNRLPLYSTSIADAWQVVEKMRAMGKEAELFWTDQGCEVFFARESSIHEGYGFTTTMPRAICRAALKAVGVEVE
jgi:hypothetical protein